MGRLTLNILLSFAQFEREVIGERIRDKVAASKARGMWMGGKVPLGYDVANRKLVVNEAEARNVRCVFEYFAETASGTETVQRLQAQRITSKSGRLLNKGDVYKILNLRTYVGEVEHKGRIYPGEHQALVTRALWNKVHALLQTSPRAGAVQNRRHQTALLKGLIFGLDGRALSPTHSRKKGRMYRYYVAQRVLKEEPTGGDDKIASGRSAYEWHENRFEPAQRRPADGTCTSAAWGAWRAHRRQIHPCRHPLAALHPPATRPARAFLAL